MKWFVYIILCSDASLYTGITTDIARRMTQHDKGRGAKYFRGRKPVRLVYLESGHNRSSATKREISIKGMNSVEKSLLASSPLNKITDTVYSAESSIPNWQNCK